MGTPFSTPQIEESRSRVLPIAVGAGIIILLIVAIVVFTRSNQQNTGPLPEDPYASNLRVMDVKMSRAANFVGANVTYVQGQIANTGSKTIAGATVECVFRNTLGEVVDRQSQSLMLVQERPGYTDAVSLNDRPLTPNMQAEFRLTFEHISADWNQGLPELRFTRLTLK
jgi:hypothetical protein